jgi:thymidylate synthase
MNNVDKEYFRLLNTVLTNGKRKKNRTGIDTRGVFGEQAKFDVWNTPPTSLSFSTD